MVVGQNQVRTIKILLYTPDLAKNIKGLLLKIKSPTPHNPTENIRFGSFLRKRYGPLTRKALFKLGHKFGHFEREKTHLKILLVL